MSTREEKYQQTIEMRLAKLERALSRIHFSTCTNCGEFYPENYRDYVHAKGTGGMLSICVECVMHDEDVFENVTVTPQEINRHLDRWHDWTHYASNDGVKMVMGAPVTAHLNNRSHKYSPWNWTASTVLWDIAESMGHKIGKGIQFLDPRKYHWDGQILLLKGATRQTPVPA